MQKLRKKKNLTQKDLGDLIHYSDKNISKWEMGKSFPEDDETLNALAEALGVTKKELLSGGHKKFYESTIFKIMIIPVILVLALIISVIFFGRTKAYVIKTDNKNVFIENGSFLINNYYINFSINNIDMNNNYEIDTIEVYKYKDDKTEPVLIHRTNSFPININQRRNSKSTIINFPTSIVMIKIKYKNNIEQSLRLYFKSVESKYDNEEDDKEEKIFKASTSAEDYLSKVGFTEEFNSYSRVINGQFTLSYNKASYIKLEVNSKNSRRIYKISIIDGSSSLTDTSYKDGDSKNTTLDLMKYEIKDCYIDKCSSEEDYVGYLIFLKNRIVKLQK